MPWVMIVDSSATIARPCESALAASDERSRRAFAVMSAAPREIRKKGSKAGIAGREARRDPLPVLAGGAISTVSQARIMRRFLHERVAARTSVERPGEGD